MIIVWNAAVSLKRRNRTRWLLLVVALFSASILATATPLNAANQTWIGGTGNWSTTTNWTPNTWVSGNTAIFNAAAGTVTVGTQTAGGLTFNVGGYSLDNGTLTLNTGSVITTNGGTTTFTSLLNLAGAAGVTITKTGSGTLSLATSNTGLGTVAGPAVWTVTGGTFSGGTFDSVLSVTLGNNLGASPTSVTTQLFLDAGTLEVRGSGSSNGNTVGSTRTIQVNAAGGAIHDISGLSNGYNGAITDNAGSSSSLYLSNAGGTSTFSGVISGGGTVTWNGSATGLFSNTNTYSGGTTVNSGTFQLSGANGANSNAMAYTLNGGSLVLDNTTNNTNRIADASTIALNGGTFSLNGNASANSSETVGAISGSGNSTVTITAAGANTATLTAASFTHAAGNGSDLINGTGLGSSTAAKNFFISTSAPTLVGTTAGASTGINSSVKNTQIVPFLVGEATTTTGGLGTATGTADTFLTYNSTTGFRPLNPTDEFDSSTTLATVGNNVRVTAAITTPTLAINSLVIAGADLSINSGATLTDTSGALLFTTSNAIKPVAGNTTLAFGSAEGMITVNSGVTGSINSVITGSAGLTKSGGGTLSLTATNNFSGGITLNAGTVAISVGGSLGNATASANAASPPQITFAGNSTFQIGNNNLLNTRPLLINPGVTATIDTGTGNTASGLQGVISGSGNLVKIGSSPLALTGVDTYGGTTLVSSAGVLAVGSGGRLTATSSITVNNGGTLLLSGSGTADRINNAANISLGSTGNNTVAAAGGAKEGSAATVTNGTPTGTNAFGIGILNVLAASTLDFDSASNGNLLVFNGFSDPSNATVTVTNWNNADFNGTTNSGLSTDDRLVFSQNMSSFLNRFDFGAGAGVGVSEINLGGTYYELGLAAVPEPSTWVAAGLLLGLLGYSERKSVGAFLKR